MRIIEEGNPSVVTCEDCNSKIEVERGDLQWSHAEETYYYVTCPVCGKPIWIKENSFWDAMWNKQQQMKRN